MTDEDSQQIIINERELKVLIITSIHTLKRGKKKCGGEDVYNLVKESLDYQISMDDYHKTLNSLIESKSVVVRMSVNVQRLSY